MLTAALGSRDDGKERPTGAAGRVQDRGFKVPETHSSLGLGEPRAHDTRDKLACIQTPAWPSRSHRPRARQFSSETQFLTAKWTETPLLGANKPLTH